MGYNKACGSYNSNSQIQFKTKLLKLQILQSGLCYYSDAYILVKEAITILGRWVDEATRQKDEKNKQIIKIDNHLQTA